MHGTKDKEIPINWVSNFVRNLKSKGIDCVFEVYNNQEHGFFNKNVNYDNYLKTNSQIEEFLKFRDF